jgi:hypothetical protein
MNETVVAYLKALCRPSPEWSEKQEVVGRTNRLLSLIRHGPHWKRSVQQFFYCCVCIRYRGNVSTEPFSSNDRGILPSRCLATIRGYTYRHTDWWERFFNYSVEVGSDAVIYVPSFIQIGSGSEKLIVGIHTHTHTATWSHKPTLFFQNKECRLKNMKMLRIVCVPTEKRTEHIQNTSVECYR